MDVMHIIMPSADCIGCVYYLSHYCFFI